MLALSNKSTSLVKDALTSNNGEADKKSGVSGRRNNRADAMTKEEIMKSIGIVDPVIKDSIHESLSSIDYRAKSKVEVTNDVVVELEKQIDKLKYKRMKILEEEKSAHQVPSSTNEQDAEEEELQQALKEKNIEKVEAIMAQRKNKLEELSRKWAEKKGIEEMKRSSNDKIQSSQSPYKSSFTQETAKFSALKPTSTLDFLMNSAEKSSSQLFNNETPKKSEHVKELIQKSERLRLLDPKKADFDKKLSDYLVGKQLQKNTEQYFSSKEKKPFDRVRTAESFKNLQEVKKSREANSGSPISHRPVRKDVASHSRQEESFSHSPARPRVDQKTLHKTNELFIAKLVFDALDHGKEGIISKQDIMEYVGTNKDLITIFDLKSDFNKFLNNLKTGIEGFLNFKEFTDFMARNLPASTQSNIQKAFPSQPRKLNQEPLPKTQGLTESEIRLFQEIFSNLSEEESPIVSTKDYLDALKKDSRIVRIYPRPVMTIPLIEKDITVKDVLKLVEQDYQLASGYLPNKMEFISWTQFMEYFKESAISRYSTLEELVVNEEQLYIWGDKLQIIQDIFDTLPRVVEGYVDKFEFVKTVKNDPQAHSFWNENLDKHKIINLGNLMDTIVKNQRNFISWGDVIQAFSIDSYKNEDEEKLDKIHPGLAESKPFMADHIPEEAKEDSLFEHEEQVNLEHEESFRQLDENLKKEFEQLQNDFQMYGLSKKNYKDEKGLTIPKPFKFLEKEHKPKIRERKLEEMVSQKKKEEEDALNYRFKANDVPLQTKTPMFHTIIKAQEEKRAQVKQQSQQILLAHQKPFSFYERDLNKPKLEKKEEEFKPFKAKPIPEKRSCKIEVLKQKEEEDKKAREERIQKRAEELLATAKMPLNMERVQNETKKKTKLEPDAPTFKPNINKEIPDFAKLHQEDKEKREQRKAEHPKVDVKPFSFDKAEAPNNKTQSLQNVEDKPVTKKKITKKATQNLSSQNSMNNTKGQSEKEKSLRSDNQPKVNEEGQPEEDYNQDEFEKEGEQGENETEAREKGNQAEDGENYFTVEVQDQHGDQAINLQNKHKDLEPEKDHNDEGNNNTEEIDPNEHTQDSQNKKGKKSIYLTKKLEQEFEKRKKDKEDRQKIIDAKKKALEDKKQKEKEFAPKVKTAYQSANQVDKREEERLAKIKQFQEQFRQTQKDYDEKIREMNEKIAAAPLLVETKTYGSKALKRYRDLINRNALSLTETASNQERYREEDPEDNGEQNRNEEEEQL